MKKTLVLGASPNEARYSNKAVNKLRENNFEVIAVGIKDGKIADVDIIKGQPKITDIHTITIYLGEERQKEYYNYILSLKPKRIVFNPGTENSEFQKLARQNDIEVVQNCTLVMLSFGIF